MKRHCAYCNCHKQLSTHHILPKFFFRGYGETVTLCIPHHRAIERLIHEAETKRSGSKAIRFKLNENEYREILRRFLLSSDYD